MTDIHVITNHHRREILHEWDLTMAEREEFPYLDWEAIDDGRDSAEFVRYRGELIDLGENERGLGGSSHGMPRELEEWHGYRTDSFFSGLVWRYPLDDVTPTDRNGDPNYDWDLIIIGHFYVSG